MLLILITMCNISHLTIYVKKNLQICFNSYINTNNFIYLNDLIKKKTQFKFTESCLFLDIIKFSQCIIEHITIIMQNLIYFMLIAYITYYLSFLISGIAADNGFHTNKATK